MGTFIRVTLFNLGNDFFGNLENVFRFSKSMGVVEGFNNFIKRDFLFVLVRFRDVREWHDIARRERCQPPARSLKAFSRIMSSEISLSARE
jgi:hypothetical protein